MKIKDIKNLNGKMVKAIIIRKPTNIDELEIMAEREVLNSSWNSAAEQVLIENVLEYSKADYEALVSDFNKTIPLFSCYGGFSSEGGVEVRKAIVVYCPAKPIILIDSEGCDYARYVGILDPKKNR